MSPRPGRSVRRAAGPAALGLVAGLGSCGPATPNLDLPFIREGACPFECCTYRTWTALEPLVARAGPEESAPIEFPIRAGDAFEAETGRVITRRPGSAVLRTEWQGLPAGTRIPVLGYLGEGISAVWIEGRVESIEVVHPPEDETAPRYEPSGIDPWAEGEKMPVTEWWVRIRMADGSSGWVHIDPRRLPVDGADGCA